MVQETRTPAYCSVCGGKLVPNEVVQGYDPFTGDPVADASLYCPNPTIEVKPRLIGYASRTEIYHPAWANEGGTWVQN